MAHDHSYSITLLKTPWGYLTSTGFTQDINAKDIAVLPSNSYGKWSSMLRRIDFFCKAYHINPEIREKLHNHAKECETYAFYCMHGTYCEGCSKKEECQFWNADRKEIGIYRIF